MPWKYAERLAGLMAAVRTLRGPIAFPRHSSADTSLERAELSSLSMWSYAFYKTLTYETLTNISDLTVFTALNGAPPIASGLFVISNFVTSSGVYYVHEIAWSILGPTVSDSLSAAKISLAKTVTYQVAGFSQNVAIFYAFTENLSAAVAFATVNPLLYAVLYLGNEYTWLRFGPAVPSWHETKSSGWKLSLIPAPTGSARC